jgi:hypothetical protein
MHPDDWGPLATMADAHSEWHRNAGVPMGQPGCPQDACDPYPDGEEVAGWDPEPVGFPLADGTDPWAVEPPF